MQEVRNTSWIVCRGCLLGSKEDIWTRDCSPSTKLQPCCRPRPITYTGTGKNSRLPSNSPHDNSVFRYVAFTAILRSNSMPGRVFKRNEVYWIAFYCRGKEYRTSAKTARKRKAEELLAFYLGQVARGEFQGLQQEKALTLSDLFTLVLDDAEVRALRDVYHMRFRAAHLQQFFGAETPVEAITEA